LLPHVLTFMSAAYAAAAGGRQIAEGSLSVAGAASSVRE